MHAWATIFTLPSEKAQQGEGDIEWLERSFHKLLLNFTWWVNRKDRDGSNVFEGGFLGLDNIGVFDRSAPLPTGGYLEQADGTAWMALFCQNMLEIAVELALQKPAYAEMCDKFIEHFLWIASAMIQRATRRGHVGRRGRVLLRRAAAARRQRPASEGPLDGRVAAAVRRDGLRRRAHRGSIRTLRSACERFLAARPELTRLHSRPGAGGLHGPPAGVDPR